ncbi:MULTISPECIES: (Fe-S)-binding protein [unclassified Bacillus (in: firmicutes)]|uniref:(Fe-S)-binding protein n=1 Tax=unclassified Bacillus (in: firmicutes) TaxID=185979 RepID=UPI001BE7E016|nr:MULTISPECIES: (Fe-S)-binding protein [unclassified Bacillus (in: firmicutes)]MBT2616622.1 (Fe-S)-binding protein [Bacillus sp. ISL-78]MBT2631031.1 (Fe-S)-binding protein [Bacillus sp. ISL-101]MBT2716317.1 (Fe-S)-binding protein [Bacillus sp. ISL-57]
MTTVQERETIAIQFAKKMNEDELLNCMRCGFCLPHCPTYIESGLKESHSPRGRIALMKAVADGVIEPDRDVERSLSLCLGCRACEPVCPSGVKYGHLLEEARDIIHQNKKHSFPVKTIRKAVFSGLFPHQERMQTMTSLLGFYQKSGLQYMARKTGVLNMLPDNLAAMEKVLPKVPKKAEMKNRPTELPAIGTPLKTVAFFSGCLMDTMFLETNKATLKLLQLAGCEIVIPKSQACCGALHGHSGEKAGAKQLAKRNIEAFETEGVDYIITNAGGCGAFLIDYDHLLQDEQEWHDRAISFKNKLKDISQILVDLRFQEKVRLKLPAQSVTFQDSCHLRNVMNTSSAPRILLQSIEGIDFREMKDADRCCGSAGIYNIVESEMSMNILDSKMEHTKSTQADIVVTANPGCLLQMQLGIERENLGECTKAVHIADLLIKAVAL